MGDAPKSPNPQIRLELHRCLCQLHGEAFRSKWPDGYPTFTVKALDVVMGQEGFAAYVRADAGDKDCIASIEKLLDEKPLCCRLSPADLRRIYGECPMAVTAMCALCGKLGLGTPILTESRGLISHVCFDCFVTARPAKPGEGV